MAPRKTATARKAVTKDYPQIARQYARDVTEGRIPACKLLKLRCETALREWENQDSIFGGKFIFDGDRASKACKFIECLPVPDAQVEAQVQLMPWQVFVISNIFGWIHRDTGYRRFLAAHIWVAAGNGKSFLASAIGLYMAFGDDQRSAEVYCVASAKKQAEEVFNTAKQMMKFRPDFAEFIGVETLAHSLVQPRTESKLEARSSEANTLFGMRPYLAILDELHVMRADVYASVTQRLAKRNQSLQLTISTAGYHTLTQGYAIFQASLKSINSPESEVSQNTFAIIYQAESDQDILDETEWAKAHPSLGVTVKLTNLRAMANAANAISSERYKFITEQLNRWAAAPDAWITFEQWDACADPTLNMDDFEGQECLIGQDLAAVSDMTSTAIVFWRDLPDGRHYYCFWFNYLPEDAIGKRPDYHGWVRDGFIKVTPGAACDNDVVRRDIAELHQRFNVQNTIIDQANAYDFSRDLDDEGIPNVLMKIGGEKENYVSKMIERAIVSGRFHHNGDPAVRWMFGNAEVTISSHDNVRVFKADKSSKIDGVRALQYAFTGMQEPATQVWSGGLQQL